MNERLKKNIDAIQEEFESIKNALIHIDTIEHEKFDVCLETVSVGEREVLCGRKKEEELYQLESLYDDAYMPEMWIKLIQAENRSYKAKFIFFGMGNGMFVRKLLEESNDTIRVLVYEPSLDFFYDILSHTDVSDLLADPRVIWIVENIPYSASDYIYQFIDFRDLEKLGYLAFPNYRNLYPDLQRKFHNEVQVMYNAIWASQNVMSRYGSYYFDNTLRNLPDLLRSKSLVDFYAKMPKDIPFIVVSSGPSLDKNIEYLKNLKGKAFVLAVDSAIRVLLKHDIIPDMFVSIDAIKNQKHFEDPRIADIPILTEASANYRTISKVKTDKYFFNDLNAHVNQFLTENHILLPYLSSGGSVANSAYALGSSMGFKTIILAGQDLAYTDNKTHSQESVRGEWHMNTEQMEGYMTEGYYGDQVKTSYEFQLYKKWFEEEIALYPSSRTINATEGGAMIQGAENMPLKDVVEQFCTKEYDVDGILHSVEDALDDQMKRRLADYLQKAPEELTEIARRVKNAIRDYDKLLELAHDDKFKVNEMKRILARTAEVSELVEKAPVMYYIQNKMQSITQEYLEKVYAPKEDTRTEIRDTAQMGSDYLKAVLKTIEESLPEITLRIQALEDIF